MNDKPYQKAVTLADVARLAGVNKSTVSRALRDCSHVGKVTREKVLKAAESLDYRPDPAISRLAAQRWRGEGKLGREALTLLLRERSSRANRFIAYCREASEKYGYEVDIVYCSDFVSEVSLRRNLEFRGVEKILLSGFGEEDVLDPNLLRDYTVVNCGSILDQSVCSVDLDWQRMLYLAVDNLRQQGVRRIGLAVGDADLRERTILESYFSELFSDECSPIPVFSHSLKKGDLEVDLIMSWYSEYLPEAIIGVGSVGREMLRKGGVSRLLYVALHPSEEEVCDRVLGFCCGERLVVERAIQLLQLSKLLGPESRMELHHIVPDWRVPEGAEKGLIAFDGVAKVRFTH